MTKTPDFMPVLSAGKHRNAREGACIMEYISVITGEAFSDQPSSVHQVLQVAGIRVNDSLHDDHRHLLLPLVHRLIGTSRRSINVPELTLLIDMQAAYTAMFMRLIKGPAVSRIAALTELIELWECESGHGQGEPVDERELWRATQALGPASRRLTAHDNAWVWLAGEAKIELTDWQGAVIDQMTAVDPAQPVPLNYPAMAL